LILEEASWLFSLKIMSDLTKIDVLKAQLTTDSDERSAARLERADLTSIRPGQPLHNQIGRRLRNVFPAPEGMEDAFDSLLKQISSRLS
jgi:hypothetical protein